MDQFEQIPIGFITFPFLITNCDIGVVSVIVLVASLFSNFFIIFLNPRIGTLIILFLFFFVFKVVRTNIGRYYTFSSFIFFLFFFFVFSANIVGMIPYSFTITSQLVVTFTMGVILFLTLNFLCIWLHGMYFFSLFLPGGAPTIIIPLLVLIELISYTARVFSLSIRLFANLMSGHTLLKILANFSWLMISAFGIWHLLFIVPFTIVFLVTGLEIAIGMLQAYVMTILVTIYFRDAVFLH